MIRVEVVYGSVYARLVGKSSEVRSIERPTVGGLLQVLVGAHDQPFADTLMEPGGEDLQGGVAILVNGSPAVLDTVLSEGDDVTLLLSFEGG